MQALHTHLLERGGKNGRPLSRHTVLKAHTILQDALGSAVDWELIARNPADRVRPPRPQQTQIRALEPEEVIMLLDDVRQHSTWAYVPVFLAFYTGLRRSEILGLNWPDIDLIAATLSVRRGYHRLDDGTGLLHPPKSARSNRFIPLPRNTVDVLTQHPSNVARSLAAIERSPDKDDPLLIGPGGERLLPDSLSAAFRHSVARCGLSGVRFQDARHTHASLLLRAGVHAKVVSERLGHASVGFTLDIYSHVMSGIQEAAIEGLERFMAPAEAGANILAPVASAPVPTLPAGTT